MTPVQYRSLHGEDLEQIAALVADQWYAEVEPELRSTLSKAETDELLGATDWALVAHDTLEPNAAGLPGSTRSHAATQEGDLLGVAGAALKNGSRQERLSQDWEPLGGLLKAEEPNVDALERILENEFFEQDAPFTDAALELLLVSPKARGRGVGKTLIQRASDWIRSTGARGYFLMTDDACDFSFYDHLGLTLLKTYDAQKPSYDHIYIYGTTFE